MERTLVILKPDTVARSLVGRVLTRIEEKGLLIAGLKMKRLTEDEARRMYSVHKGKMFYEPLVRYIMSGPLVAVVVEGHRSIEIMRKMVGKTFGSEAAPGTIRGDFAVSNRFNVVHASDSGESFARECPIFFSDAEIFEIDACRYEWIYDTSEGEPT